MPGPPHASIVPLAETPSEAAVAAYGVSVAVVLEGLPMEETRALAGARAGEPANEAESSALARVLDEQLGGLPVAVEVAAGAVAQWAGTWTAYEQLLPRPTREALDAPDPRAAHHPHAVLTALDLAIDRCGEPTRRLLEGAALFVAYAVPLPWALAAAGLEPRTPTAEAACTELEGRALARIAEGVISLHRLVHQRARDRAEPGAWRATCSRGASVVRAWLREASGASAGADPIAARRDEIDRVLAEVDRVLDPPAWSALARLLADHHLLHGRSTEARALLWRALPIEEARLGPDHPELAVVLSTLAAAVAPPEGRELMWRILDDPEALFVVDGLDITSAVGFARRALDIDSRVYGPAHAQVARRLSELALLLRDAEAPPLLERALAIAELALPAGHPDVVRYQQSLATVWARLREPRGRGGEGAGVST